MVNSHIVVDISQVSICQQNQWVLNQISLQCMEGDLTLIHGPTGAGKSTLLKAINGLCVPSEGHISIMGTTLPGRNRRQARVVWRQTGTVLQEVALFETKTAQENVALGLRAIGLDRASASAQALNWLERLQLGTKASDYPNYLSGGERQRVALARALAPSPRLLVMDEPISALDQKMAATVLKEIKTLAEQGTTVVMVSHRVDEIFELCNQHIELRDGCIWQIEQLNTGTTNFTAEAPVGLQEPVANELHLVNRQKETNLAYPS